MIKFLKKITLFNNIINLKQYWLSHIAILSFYFCEICVFILTLIETISEQIDLKNGIVIDYIFGFKTYFLINHLLGFILLGLFDIALLILFFIFKFIFKKNFFIKAKFFTNNHFYHIFWTFGFYITAIVVICMAIYLISISYEGFLWLLDK